MKTYVEILHSADGEKVSVIFDKMIKLGFEPALGEHEFVYIWKGNPTLPEVINFLDNVVLKIKGTKAILKFTTIR
jgi:hypothetical protein